MVFGVADDNVPMRESLKNLIRAVGSLKVLPRFAIYKSAERVGAA
jgi:hypothetical protein